MIYIEIAVAVIAIVMTALPAFGKIRRNRFVGVRTRATLSSDTAWEKGHKAALLPMCVTGGIAIVGGVTGLALGYVNEPFITVVLALVLLAGAAWSTAAARRAVS